MSGKYALVALVFFCLRSLSIADEPLKGWERLAQRLIADGAPKDLVFNTFSNYKMQPYTPVFFQIKPKEAARSYQHFYNPRSITLAKNELAKWNEWFTSAENKFKVAKEAVAAILLVETKFGQYLGGASVINRLARLANIAQPSNLQHVYKHRVDRLVPFSDFQDRASYLEMLFYPEVKALFELADREKTTVFNFEGSQAGAFGIPQFLPTSLIQYGVDANQNSRVSLFEMPDAIHSTANYLASQRWDDDNLDQQRAAVYHYNRSDAYVDAILKVKKLLESL